MKSQLMLQKLTISPCKLDQIGTLLSKWDKNPQLFGQTHLQLDAGDPHGLAVCVAEPAEQRRGAQVLAEWELKTLETLEVN